MSNRMETITRRVDKVMKVVNGIIGLFTKRNLKIAGVLLLIFLFFYFELPSIIITKLRPNLTEGDLVGHQVLVAKENRDKVLPYFPSTDADIYLKTYASDGVKEEYILSVKAQYSSNEKIDNVIILENGRVIINAHKSIIEGVWPIYIYKDGESEILGEYSARKLLSINQKIIGIIEYEYDNRFRMREDRNEERFGKYKFKAININTKEVVKESDIIYIINAGNISTDEHAYFSPTNTTTTIGEYGDRVFNNIISQDGYNLKLGARIGEKGRSEIRYAIINCDLTKDYGCEIERETPKDYEYYRFIDDNTAMTGTGKEKISLCFLGIDIACISYKTDGIALVDLNKDKKKKIDNIMVGEFIDYGDRYITYTKLSQNKDFILYAIYNEYYDNDRIDAYVLDPRTKRKMLIEEDAIALDMR